MEKETGFSHTESLALIESMINKAKDRFNEDGFIYLLWGWLVLILSVTEFVLQRLNYEKHYLVWLVTWLAVIYQIFHLRRKNRRINVRTYTEEIVKYVWITFGIIMFLEGFLFGAILGPEYYKLINPCFMALYGMPIFLSGIILRFKPLVWGGIGCWILSILATVVPKEFSILLVSVAMIIAWIVPGYLLRLKYKNQTADYGQ
jgi:FtsH-binding integral membrane protein